jgi:HEAT repeat protein/TolA-binding protein
MVPLLPLFAAVTFAWQGTPAPVTPKTPTAPFNVLTAQLDQLVVQANRALGPMSVQLATLGTQLESLQGLQGLAALDGLDALDAHRRAFATTPPAPWADQDPGDSLYRAGRDLLNRGRYDEAAGMLQRLISVYPRSSYTPDAYYWAAFAFYKTDRDENLRRAVRLLDAQASRYAKAATRGDGDALLVRVLGELARRGDEPSSQRLHRMVKDTTTATSTTTTTTTSNRTTTSCSSDDDDDPRVAAMNALLQMDAANAVPIIKQVLAKRDACSVGLRRKAVFVLSQKRTEETEDILLSVARNDPDSDVRQQAVFWLSQVGTEKALTALDSILRTSTDPELLDKAVFAVSQIRSDRAAQILRDYAGRDNAPEDVREKAVFWLGQQHSTSSADFLRTLYARVTVEDLKEKIIFSLSQMHSDENTRWLMDLALNEHESIDLRKKALFWAGQTGAAIADLVQLYDRTTDHDMREQLIFVYSQRHETQALDKMIDIARHETDRELRKKAIFWLGQSRDPRAAQALLEIINQ